LWPGYGENSRVLKWICERIEGAAKAQTTAIGNLPTPDALDLSGLNVPIEDIKEITSVDVPGWKKSLADVEANFARFGNHLPIELTKQLSELRKRLD
jgi:phosphoenolpyruvate carboxykinase (GTP)